MTPPAAPGGAPVPDAPAPEAAALRAQVVLIVDDELDILESLRELFESSLQGVRVLTAPSGAAALDLLRSEGAVDLVITDYKMPGMNGLQFLARAREASPKVPRILMTAFPDLDLAIRAINDERIESFLTKPLDPANVLEGARAILYERRTGELRDQAFARSLDMLRAQLRQTSP